MKSRIFGHRDRTLAVIAIVIGVMDDVYLGHAWLVTGWDWWAHNYQAVAPIFTWSGGAVAAWVALSQLSIARKRHDAQVKRDDAQTKADRQRHIQESFTTAVEQLSSDKLQVRLGGIYTLERLYKLQHIYSQESQDNRTFVDEYWTIMEIFTSFIREAVQDERPYIPLETAYTQDEAAEASETEYTSLPSDIIASLTVLGRRPPWASEIEKNENLRLDLRKLDLSNIDMGGFNLRHANLEYVNLSRARLEGANLQGANLFESCLNKVDFEAAYLDGADLSGSRLIGAYFNKADLRGINLVGTYMMKACLHRANAVGAILFAANLTDADLSQANLSYADLSEVDFTRADLDETNLTGADVRRSNFARAKNLTFEQLELAKGNRLTKLPKCMEFPPHWPKD